MEKSPVKINRSGLPGNKIDTFSFLHKPVLLATGTFIILAFLFMLLIYQRYKLVQEAKLKADAEIVNKTKDKIQEALTHSLSATKTLSFFIDKNGIVNNFDSISEQILESGYSIDALQLVPDGIIQYVYPFKGNEQVIGYNILQDSSRNKEAYKAIEKKQMFFAEPFMLRQGGLGVVGRLPVYRNNKFWGFSAVIIKMSTLFETAGIDSSGKNGYYFQLSKQNPDTKEEEYFLPQQINQSEGRSVSVKVPDGEWKLSVISKKNYEGLGDIVLLAILGFALSLFGSISVYRFAIAPQKLKNLVKAKTSELENSKIKYRSLIERVSDAFVSLDKNWNYTYLNYQAGEIFSREPQSLIGKHIWTEFPEGIDQPFYHAYYRAMATQTYQYLEEYYPPLDKWFENHIYPSKEGLTIFFKDVTEMKQATLTLKNNEEKYRSLIEQASDGIVITDLEGGILEVNNSIKQMIGFDEEELIGHHLTEYLPNEDIDDIPLRINELMQGKSLLYERRLLKKDGTIMPVEINSKMASTHTLIGFVRDISQRNQAAAALKKSNERFELIAEATNDVIWDHDFITNITWGNKNLFKLYGIEPGSGTINFEMFMEHIHPDDRAGIKIRLDEAMKEQLTSVTEDFRFRMPDGQYRIFYDRAYIKYDEAGNPLKILGAMQDITETENFKQLIIREKELSDSVINSLPGIFYLYNKEGKFLRWNKNLETVTGYSTEEISKLHPLSLIDDSAKEMISKKIENVFQSGEDNVESELLLKNKEKVPYYFTGMATEYEGETCMMGIGLDFSDKVKARKAVLASEEKYRLIIDQASDGIFMANADMNFVDVNEAACKMLGYTLQELKKMQINDLIPEEDKQTNPVKMEMLKAGEAIINERRFIKKDGSLIDVEISAKQLPDGRFQSIARDITERKKAAEKLVEKEKKLQQVLASTADNFYVIDTDYNVVIINKVAERNLEIAWGKPVSIGTNLLDVIPLKGEEPIRENFVRAFAGEGFEYEIFLSHPDLPTCVLIQFSPVSDESGRITGVSVIAKDISERKKTEELIRESEERYRALVENAPEALVVFNVKKLMFVNVSESATRLFGMSKEDLLKIGPVDLSPKYQPDGRLSAEAAPVNIQKAINGEKLSFEWTHCNKSGELISCEVWLVRLPAENEVLIRGSIVDITERNKAKELLQKSYDEIRELASNLQSIREDERTNIAREIHDELGQQLTGLKMDLHWLTKKINSPDAGINRKMAESINLINATISSVRKISTDLRPSILDDLGLVAALEWQGEEFEKRSDTQVKFTNEAGEIVTEPEVVTAIFRIYQELLTNIARHANASLVKAILKKENDKLILRITDNGTGFNLESIKNKKTLGLLGIKERTLILGGTYEFKSNPGEGSETIISIPLITK